MNEFPSSESFATPAGSPAQPELNDISLGQPAALPQPAEEIDLDAIALPQNFSDLAAVKTDTSVKIQKPTKQTWFAPHPDQTSWKVYATIEDQNDFRALYVLSSAIANDLEKSEWARRALVPCITRQGNLFIWPLRVPDDEGKLDSWSRSASEIVTSSGNQWIRITANHEAQGYVSCRPVSPQSDPVWPKDLAEVMRKAVMQRLISNTDHPLLKHLRGEI